MDCIIRIAMAKALISCTITAQLICVFVFAYTKIRFSHTEPHTDKDDFNGLFVDQTA